MSVIETVKTYAQVSIFLLPIVMGLVTLYGKFGVSGKWQLVSSLVTGFVLGGGIMYVETKPVTVEGWMAVVIYGILLGLTASGVYDVLKVAATKAVTIAGK